MIISAEFAVVLGIVVTTHKLSISFKTDDFKYIQRAWLVNLLYIFFELINWYLKTVNGSMFRNKVLELSITFVDVLQFALLYQTLVKTNYEFSQKIIIKKIGSYWYLIAIGVFTINSIWSWHSIDLYPYLEYHLIPNVVFNVIALFYSAKFFKSLFEKYRVPHIAIYVGSIIYAFIQIAALAELPQKQENWLIAIAWFFGLVSKCLICWGLLLIFKGEAARSRRLEKILGNIFHELKNTLYGIDAPVKRILYEKYARPKNEAQEIERSYETMASIIDATWLMYKNDLDNVKENHEIEMNLQNLIAKNKQSARLNSLVEISIKIVKNLSGDKVKYHCDYGGGCEILCFKHEIIQIIVNLLKNSYESFPDGVGNIFITTRKKYLTENGEEIRNVSLEVLDDGPGIPLEIQSKIYELEFSTKKEKAGSGRGLAVVKELINLSYGNIEFESPVKNIPYIENGGTRFKIIFQNNYST
jgi:signal transduction histidine kinase